MKHELIDGILTIWPEPTDLTALEITYADEEGEDGGEVEQQVGKLSDEVMELIKSGQVKDMQVSLKYMRMSDKKTYSSDYGILSNQQQMGIYGKKE